MNCSVVAHELLRRDSRVVLPRVGGGVGGGEGGALLHASSAYWCAPQPVDNPLASAAAALDSRVGCRSAIAGWVG